MTKDNTQSELPKRGRPKLTESDRIWNEIRDCLTNSAMANMTIPQAKVFSATAALHLGLHFRKLVDMEIEEVLDRLEKQTREYEEDTTEVAGYPESRWHDAVPLSAIETERSILRGSDEQ